MHAWDAITGENTIGVAGGTVTNVSVLSTADNIMLNPGDTVGLIRFKSTYFILGRLAPPGGGAALGMRSASVDTMVNQGALTWGDLTGSFGPQLTNVYIGSSRRCLVLVGATIAYSQSDGYIGFEVSGASDISPSGGQAAVNGGDVALTGQSVTPFSSVLKAVLLDETHGLRTGLNTFTCKYSVVLRGAGTGAQFFNRSLTVLPF